MEVRFFTITPNDAQKIIDADKAVRKDNPFIVDNRPLYKSVVEKYSREMTNGNWAKNWDAIVISPEGVVINGQHRLEAVVKSQTTQTMLFILDADATLVGDIGKSRSAKDILTISGYDTSGLVYSTYGVGAVRAILKYLGGIMTPTAFDVHDFIESEHSSGLEYILEENRRAGAKVKSANVVAGIFGAWVCTKDERVFEFARQLSDGIGASAPALGLREYLIRRDTKHGQVDTIKRTQYAICAHLKGRKTKITKCPDEYIYMPSKADLGIEQEEK